MALSDKKVNFPTARVNRKQYLSLSNVAKFNVVKKGGALLLVRPLSMSGPPDRLVKGSGEEGILSVAVWAVNGRSPGWHTPTRYCTLQDGRSRSAKLELPIGGRERILGEYHNTFLPSHPG